MPYDPVLAGRIRAVLADRRDVVEKHMFGGVCFMVRGHMACGIVESSLMVRLTPEEADRLAEEPHVRPMDFTGRPMRGFLYVDPEGVATAWSLRTWVGRTVTVAESQPEKKPGLARRAGATKPMGAGRKKAAARRLVG